MKLNKRDKLFPKYFKNRLNLNMLFRGTVQLFFGRVNYSERYLSAKWEHGLSLCFKLIFISNLLCYFLLSFTFFLFLFFFYICLDVTHLTNEHRTHHCTPLADEGNYAYCQSRGAHYIKYI